MIRALSAAVLALLLTLTASVSGQTGTDTQEQSPDNQGPSANPGRPTISTPATLTPVGYFQFETGFLAAWHSPEFSSQSSLNETVKFSISRRFQLLAEAGPFAHSRAANQTRNDAGDVLLGIQGVVCQGEGVRPTFAVSYFRRIYNGDAPNLDIGGPRNSLLFMASADVKGFHYDTNYFFNEVIDEHAIHRAQFGQTLSVSHALTKKFGISGEIWHFTQPFLRSRAVGVLWALNYNVRRNLVIDAGFDRGLTSTSTRWELFAGFTYLLPHRVLRH